MIEIKDNGEIIIDGKKISELTNDGKSKTITKNVVIKNGKVVHESTKEGEGDFPDEEFDDDFEDDDEEFFKSNSPSKITCRYCGSKYKSSETKCPNCGANN